MKKLLVLIVGVCLVAFVGAPLAKGKEKHNHHDLKSLISHKDGSKEVHKNGKHHVSVEMKGGKIKDFKVKHDTKGDVAVKKLKHNKKLALLDGNPDDAVPTQDVVGTTYIGYSFVDESGNTEIYWVEYDMVLDPSGAIDYVPVN